MLRHTHGTYFLHDNTYYFDDLIDDYITHACFFDDLLDMLLDS